MLKLLGIFDLIFGVALLAVKLGLSEKIAIICAIPVIIKSIIFFSNGVSLADLVLMAFLFIGKSLAWWLVMVWFLQKGLFSLFA
jgi:hypothetical protein